MVLAEAVEDQKMLLVQRVVQVESVDSLEEQAEVVVRAKLETNLGQVGMVAQES